MSNIVQAQYEGLIVHFTEEAWFNATEAAERHGKRPIDWLRLDETKAYIAALAELIGSEPGSLLKTKRGGRGIGGSTWMHPRLAVPFARWLDVRFGAWCDLQIDALIRGKHPHHDWKRLRHEAASSFKVMNQILKLTRDEAGKASAPHHFSNEARLVNYALTGQFGSVDRNSLSVSDLDQLAKLEERNAVLIGRGVEYADRKKMLEQFALDCRLQQTAALAA